MIIVSGLILTLYGILIIAFIIGFDRIESFNAIASTFKTKFSIVIPFRDEAQALPVLIKSLKQLEYPSDKFEMIFVDDDSQDGSVNAIQRGFDCTQPEIKILINNLKSSSPKKDAVKTAIAQAKFDWIITTDADCIVSKNWLQIFDAFIQHHHPKLIAAPVSYNIGNSLLDQFQCLDILSLQGSTIGGFGIDKPFLCNGANLCYEKQAFNDVNGFEGNKHIASGDDIFLLEKMSANYPDKVHFLKSDQAITRTDPEITLKKLISQRIRWAAKTTSYKNNFSKLVGISVFSMNALLILLSLGSLIGYYSWLSFIIIFIIKFCLDFILLFKTATFFNQQQVLKHYFWSSIMYPFFIIFIALTSLTSGYSWKGRTYKK